MFYGIHKHIDLAYIYIFQCIQAIPRHFDTRPPIVIRGGGQERKGIIQNGRQNRQQFYDRTT